MDPFRCPECGEVKLTVPHNDWGRTCFGLNRIVENILEEKKEVLEVVYQAPKIELPVVPEISAIPLLSIP